MKEYELIDSILYQSFKEAMNETYHLHTIDGILIYALKIVKLGDYWKVNYYG